jgi:hypothetical protein
MNSPPKVDPTAAGVVADAPPAPAAVVPAAEPASKKAKGGKGAVKPKAEKKAKPSTKTSASATTAAAAAPPPPSKSKKAAVPIEEAEMGSADGKKRARKPRKKEDGPRAPAHFVYKHAKDEFGFNEVFSNADKWSSFIEHVRFKEFKASYLAGRGFAEPDKKIRTGEQDE